MAPASKTRIRPGGSNDPLSAYRSKRNFDITAEPAGDVATTSPTPSLPFVVQKHAATQLHYDFRLGWNGVLKSWAVAKGPSYYPGDKRLAVMVEDHPWEYRGFEGIIPKGQYGGGTVMVWDEGNWAPLGDVDRGLEEGHLKFELHGSKLKGSWALIRMNGFSRDRGPSGKSNWLLIKEKDELARSESSPPITVEAPDSAVSGRTIEQIAAAMGPVWNSRAQEESQNSSPAKPPARAAKIPKPDRHIAAQIESAPLERFPGFIAPQLAQQTSAAPSGDDWLHELKFDGYRIQIHLRPLGNKRAEKSVALLTRKGLDWTSRMAGIANAAHDLQAESLILDGEAVALDKNGISSFADLQAAFSEGRQQYIVYFAFDILHLDGHNLRGLPLRTRREILSALLARATASPLRFSDAIVGDGPTVHRHACSLGAEGIVSKLVSSTYSSARTGTWLKIKCRLEQEFVIGGFTLPSKGTPGVGALLLGFYQGKTLRYAGRAGTGFTHQTHLALRRQLDALASRQSPFDQVPAAMRRGAHWVKPQLVAQISFSTWTRDNLVRQAAFKGLREDKPAAEVVREAALPFKAVAPPSAARQAPAPARPKNTSIALPAITHPDKVLDAESGITKHDLAAYYVAVADHLLPHIAGRPLSIVRCPGGVNKQCFFQKHAGPGLAEGVGSVTIRNRKSGDNEEFLTVDSPQGLLGLAQMGAIEIHPWGSSNRSLEKPDRIIFDLDPDPVLPWKTLAQTAREFKKRLEKIGLECFVKTTGGKGLHVVAPIRPEHAWPEIKDFAHRLVVDMERANPGLYLTTMSKAARKNRIYLDYLRNDRESTAVAPFSPRARSGLPVAVPLHWADLNRAGAPAFHLSDFQQWKKRLRNDPWLEMQQSTRKLSLAAR